MHGNPEIYVLTLATGTIRRLTRNAGIDTEPTWAPSGRQLAFISDRNGAPAVYVMDAEGTSVRQLTAGGFHTQPRWSPKGDSLVYTARQGVHDLWIVNVDGSNPRKLTGGEADSQGATWAPNGRHLAFQSNRNGPLADLRDAGRRFGAGGRHPRPRRLDKSLVVASTTVIPLIR